MSRSFKSLCLLNDSADNHIKTCACAPALGPWIGRVVSSGRPIVRELPRKSFGQDSERTLSSERSRTFNDNKSFPYATITERTSYHAFDLEGIAVDGYGYVVTITAEHSKQYQGQSNSKLGTWWTGHGTKLGLASPRRLFSRMRSGDGSVYRRGEGIPLENAAIGITTRRSLEIRQSYNRNAYMKHPRGWEVHHPFPRTQSTEKANLRTKPTTEFMSNKSLLGDWNRTFFNDDQSKNYF
jgi:hypothetical protein